MKGEDITETGWTAEKEANIREDFIWGVGPEALYQISRAEYKTEPDNIKIKDLIRLYTEHYLPKRNIYITTEEISPGQNNRKTKHPKKSGDDLSRSKKNVILVPYQLKNY